MRYEIIHSPDRFIDKQGSYMEREFLSLLSVFQREVGDNREKTGSVEKEIGGGELIDDVFFGQKIYAKRLKNGDFMIGIRLCEKDGKKEVDYYWRVKSNESKQELSMTMNALYIGFKIGGIGAVDMSEEPMDIEYGVKYDKIIARLAANHFKSPLRHIVVISNNQGDRKQRYLDMGYVVFDDDFNVLERIYQPK